MQIQLANVGFKGTDALLFALNLVTLLMQIQSLTAVAYIPRRCYLL